jgi:20S proteasome subunit beta 7
LAIPILRRLIPEAGPPDVEDAGVAKVTREQAIAAVKECMKVLFYRDARSLDQYSLAVVTKDGVELDENVKLEGQSWQFAEGIRGYGS